MRWAAAIVVLVSFAAQAQSYVRTVAGMSGETVICVVWNKRELTYRVDTAGSAKTPGDSEFTAVDAAFSSWQALSDSCSDFKIIRGARIDRPKVGKGTEADQVLSFRETSCRDVVAPGDPCLADGSCANASDPNGNPYACWDHSDGTIGLTTLTFSTRTGIILDADIEFNAATYLFTTISAPPCEAGREDVSCVAYDVQNTATHEIGHVLGFDHVDDPLSTMAPTAPVGETGKRAIDLGTAEGFCSTYARGQPPLPCDEQAQLSRHIDAQNAGSFGCGCGAVEGPWGLLAGLLVFAPRRRRH
ncbi:MAG: matrixin family metalloprotease [Myxococcales bacterium]|nr:matrixin family metalloprotease [Myxococcales bacterium]